MIRPLPLYIGFRYTRAKRRNHFISFISLASMLGIALGVTVLITVLSVINGFDEQIRSRFFALSPHVTVFTSYDISKTWRDLAERIGKMPEVQGVAPYVSGNGLVIHHNQINGMQVVGIDPQEQGKVSQLKQSIVSGNLHGLKPGQYQLIMGKSLANSLAVKVGDSINLFTPQINITLAGAFPRYRQFKIGGLFEASSGFGFENSVVFINLQDAQKLFPPSIGMSGLYVQLKNLYDADAVSNKIRDFLPAGYGVTNWTVDYGAFFQALVMEKIVLFIILLLIVAVATFNLVSSLVMAVNEKRADIAILRTLGASPNTIMTTFIVQGAIIGLAGVILGLIGGLLLAANITQIANGIQNLFHIQFLSASVFFVDFLPSKIKVWDVIGICLAAWGLSLLATLYPAFMAFKTQPAEALRYE